MAADRTGFRLPMLHRLEQGRPCDPLMALLERTDGGVVCECLRLHMSDGNFFQSWNDKIEKLKKYAAKAIAKSDCENTYVT